MDFPCLYKSRSSRDMLLVSLLPSWTLLRRKTALTFEERSKAAATPVSLKARQVGSLGKQLERPY